MHELVQPESISATFVKDFVVSMVVVRATGTPDSRRILSDITVYNYDTTHLQENPQRLG